MNILKDWQSPFYNMVMSPDNADGGDGGGDGADENVNDDQGGDDQDDGNNGGGDDAKANAGDIYRPEGIADHYLGKNNNETIDNLHKAVAGFRKDLAKKAGVPEKLDDYKIDLPDEISSVLLKPGEDGSDPVFEHMRGVFHENGIAPDKAAALMGAYAQQVQALTAAAQEGGGDGADDLDFDFKTMGGIEKAQPAIDGHTSFIEGLVSVEKISKDAAEELLTLTTYPKGLSVLNELRPLLGDKKIPLSIQSSGADGQITEESLNEQMRDPKYWRDKDPEFVAKVTEGFQKLYNKSA